MSLIKKLKGKSKNQKDIEREFRYRQAKTSINKHIQQLEKVQKMVYEQGKQAASIDDTTFVRRQAMKYVSIGERIRKGQRLILLMEEARLQRDLVKISGDFVIFAQDITESILEGPDIDNITEMHLELEKGLSKAEKIDEALSMAVDIASESIMASENMSENSIDSIITSMEGDVIDDESDLDERISKGVKDIENQMHNVEG